MRGRFNLTTPQPVLARFGFIDWTESGSSRASTLRRARRL
jgi:hypothetical protein